MNNSLIWRTKRIAVIRSLLSSGERPNFCNRNPIEIEAVKDPVKVGFA